MEVSQVSHRIITDLLRSRTGQQMSEARRWRIDTALAGIFREHGIDNADQLVCLLAQSKESGLATRVVEALLNNETYFFRDRGRFDGIVERVLPDLRDKRAAQKRLSIWSAGCSTGQEVLSLAMLFAEQPARWKDWTIEILGTDVSASAIAAAQAATYSQFEIQRGLGIGQMITFFDETENGWRPSDKLRSFARFRQHNLLKGAPSPERFDLVLCRNVLLYFDLKTRRSAFDSLAQGTADDGWLMLGAGETTIGQTARFQPERDSVGLYRPVGATCAGGAAFPGNPIRTSA